MKEQSEKKIRITVDLTPALYERLNELEKNVEASSKADVVREALRLYEFFANKAAAGYTFSMTSEKGEQERLVLFK